MYLDAAVVACVDWRHRCAILHSCMHLTSQPLTPRLCAHYATRRAVQSANKAAEQMDKLDGY